MKKLYYAFTTLEMMEYFEKKVAERPIEIKHKFDTVSQNGEALKGYVLEAEEGIIDSKYEFQIEDYL